MRSEGTERAVLLVEDEWLLREALATDLREAGWTVLEASTGAGALSALRSNRKIDVVVTDIQLSGALTGWDIAEAIRDVSNTSIIYTSGNPSNSARRVPGSIFFKKPYLNAEVIETCQKLRDWKSEARRA